MKILQLSTFVIYFLAIVLIAIISHKKQKSDTTFVLGNRSLNFWLTALSAHASDMSNWLFMAFPASIFLVGIFNVWAAIGLVGIMFLNWHFVAPKIRTQTEKMNNLTMYSYFETRFKDTSGILKGLSAFMSLVFYLVYITSGLVGLGLLAESLFGLSYTTGITIGLILVVFYVFLGGYLTVAWIDLFQGFFLLGIILIIPFILISKIGGFSPIIDAMHAQNLTTSIFPNYSIKTLINSLIIALGWGLGYFGQPHIITKFMGIKDVSQMPKAKYLGISWQSLALFGAILFGLIGIYLYPKGLENPELIIIETVKTYLPAFFSGLILCAILAVSTNVMAAQILVVASSLAEDFYRGLFYKKATHRQTLIASRISVVLVGLISFVIAYFKISTIYKLVLYAWSGLGACFGPLLLISLYYKKTNRLAAFMGIFTGGIVSGIWPIISSKFNLEVFPIIPGFIASSLMIFIFSQKKGNKNE